MKQALLWKLKLREVKYTKSSKLSSGRHKIWTQGVEKLGREGRYSTVGALVIQVNIIYELGTVRWYKYKW